MNTKSELNEYINSKTKQFIRTSGFDTKQDGAEAKLKAAIQPKLKQWIAEAIAAGC